MSLEQLLDDIEQGAEELENLGVGPGDIQWTQRTGAMENNIAQAGDPTQTTGALDIDGAAPFSWVAAATAAEAREAFVVLSGFAKQSSDASMRARALRTIREIINQFKTSTGGAGTGTGATTGAGASTGTQRR